MSGIIDNLLGQLREKDEIFVPGIVPSNGFLYNFFAISDSRNITSAGAHIASKTEWETLIEYLGGSSVAGNKLKVLGLIHWNNDKGTNETGFNGRGSGVRFNTPTNFSQFKAASYIYTSTASPTNGWYFLLQSSSGSIYNNGNYFPLCGMATCAIKDSTALSNGQRGTYTGNDGKIYSTVCIGNQEWITYLCETKYRNGDLIPVVTDNDAWSALTTGARCSYNNDQSNAFTTTTEPFIKIDKYLGRARQFTPSGAASLMVDKILGKVRNAAVSNYPDNAVVTTLTGNYIVSVDGKFVLTVDGFVPLNAMRTLQGNPVVTKNNEYITI